MSKLIQSLLSRLNLILVAMKLVLLFLLVFQSLSDWEIEVKKIITSDDLKVFFCLESGNEVAAIGDSGKAAGVLQIHPNCVIEVNKHFGTAYEHADMFGRIDAVDVFFKYLAIGSRHYFKKYGEKPAKMDYIRMWNGGCYNGYLKESTLPYYQKFQNRAYELSKHGEKGCDN